MRETRKAQCGEWNNSDYDTRNAKSLRGRGSPVLRTRRRHHCRGVPGESLARVKTLDSIPKRCNYLSGLDTAAKSSEQQILQPVPRLRLSCAGITFEGRVDFAMNEEQWKSVTGYDGLYEVSNQGRVRALFESWNGRYKAGRILTPLNRPDGYIAVNLYYPGAKQKGRSRPVHSLVLEAFSGQRPDGCVSRHLDGTKSNNWLSNLQWGTYSENMKDAVCHGTFTCGEKSNLAKLTAGDVIRIRALFDAGNPPIRIAEQFNITSPQASRIGRRKSWANLPETATPL